MRGEGFNTFSMRLIFRDESGPSCAYWAMDASSVFHNSVLLLFHTTTTTIVVETQGSWNSLQTEWTSLYVAGRGEVGELGSYVKRPLSYHLKKLVRYKC